jgi:hypothetical protein
VQKDTIQQDIILDNKVLLEGSHSPKLKYYLTKFAIDVQIRFCSPFLIPEKEKSRYFICVTQKRVKRQINKLWKTKTA